MSLLAKLASELGLKPHELAVGNTRVAKLMRRDGVEATPEYLRVFGLPTRPENPEDDIDACRLAEMLTKRWARPGAAMKLRPAQARALGDLYDFAGSFADLPVGSGKTPISYMAGAVVGARRPVLLAPAALIREGGKTDRDFETLSHIFDVPLAPKRISYESLGNKDGDDILAAAAPDCIIADEGHALLNLNAGVTKKVERYLQECHSKGKLVFLLIMSGTITTRGIASYHHLLKWCTEYDDHTSSCPLPTTQSEAAHWGRAVDVKIKDGVRVSPGVLGDTTEIARARVLHRIRTAPGVTWSPAPAVRANLRIKVWSPELPSILVEAVAEASAGRRPDGELFETEDDQSRALRTLPLGFWHRWKVEPSKEWKNRRRSWLSFVADVLASRQPGLDTRGQVEHAAAAGRWGFENNWCWDNWVAVRDQEPPREAVRIAELDYDMLREVCPGPTLVWCAYREAGHNFEREGIRYYGEEGLDSRGRFIEDDPAQHSIALSVQANSVGRNLQHRWHRNLILTPSSSASAYEQLIGRTYRVGQEADTVHATIYAPTTRCRGAFFSALREARETKTMLLARADIE